MGECIELWQQEIKDKICNHNAGYNAAQKKKFEEEI